MDDTVSHNINDQKLIEIWLVYGDILLYQQLFPGKDTKQKKSCKERKKELKKKLKRTHNLRKNKEKQQICYKFTFGLKFYEKKGYICKRNKHFTSDCSCNPTYSELHQKAYYHIPESSETYLATFYDKKIETGFKDLGTYVLTQRKKKKAIHLYLYYPRSSWKLELHQIKNDYDDGELHRKFGETEYTFNEVRWCVFLGTLLVW